MTEKIVVHVDPDLEALIPGFLQNRHRDVASLREHLRAEAFDEIRTIGHSMKGAGGGYGFDAISDIGARIEQAALARDGDTVAAGIEELAGYLERVEVTYD